MIAAPRVALVGFGEVGQTIAADLRGAAVTDITSWDRLFVCATSGPIRAAAANGRVRVADNMASAVADRALVISAVTAGECLAAAREAAAALRPGAFFLDLNSVAPSTKVAAAAAIESAGGRYVEAAVMSPIAAKRIASPMLLGGPHARAFEPHARALGFAGVRIFDDAVGRASAAKMCRSVMIKGLEALLTESLVAARHHRVEDTVLESLRDLFPHEDWPRIAAYMISRSLQHGRRRAEEMREAAHTVAQAGMEPWMSAACANRQDWTAGRAPTDDGVPLVRLLDALLERARAEPTEKA